MTLEESQAIPDGPLDADEAVDVVYEPPTEILPTTEYEKECRRLLDWYAGLAMQGFIAGMGRDKETLTADFRIRKVDEETRRRNESLKSDLLDGIAELSWEYAECLMKVRTEKIFVHSTCLARECKGGFHCECFCHSYGEGGF